MMNPKKLCVYKDILALKILISDMNERLQERIEELTEIELGLHVSGGKRGDG